MLKLRTAPCGCCDGCDDPVAYLRENGFLPGLAQFENFGGGHIVRAQPNNLWLSASFPGPPGQIYGEVNGHGRAHPVNPPFDSIYSDGTWYGRRHLMPYHECGYLIARLNHHELPVYEPRYGFQYSSMVAMYAHFVHRIQLDDLVEDGPFSSGPRPFNNLTVNGFRVSIQPKGTFEHITQYAVAVTRSLQHGFPGGIPSEADYFWGAVDVDFVEGAELMYAVTLHKIDGPELSLEDAIWKLEVFYNEELVVTHYLAKDPDSFHPSDFPDNPEVEDLHMMQIYAGDPPGSSGGGFLGFHCPGTMEIDNYRAWVGSFGFGGF